MQNPVDILINEATKYSTTNAKLLVLYGISQNPDTNDYILVFSNENFGKDCIICDEIYTDIQYKWCKPCNFISWKSGDDKIDSLIQLKINERSDTRFEWIPFNQFNKIRKIGKGMFVSIYAAIWEYEVTLLYYNDSQKLLDKVEEFDSSCKIYGLSQNSDKKDYILALQKEYCMEYGKKYCKNCGIKFTQIRYLWLDKKMYTRVSNKKVALKCLNNSPNLTDKLLNEVSEYSINKNSSILNVYGISQDPDTKKIIIVLEYAEGGSYSNWINNNYKDFDWKNKIQTLLSIIEGLGGIHKKHKAADIYSFGMIMYFTATGKQPFNNCAHDHDLKLEICNGIRPEVNELEAPKCYTDLMRRCWDSNPDNRPNAIEINVELKSFYDCYSSYKKGDSNVIEIRKQFKEAEIYRKSHLSSFKKNKNHPEAIYTSQLL
ncbi:kinase-like domain-containing protein [Rhizophagus irregularis DAOM 181602=DAOM 197198]|nr:kinase-like domain-containing protein [Rhizophagus irregularis DAOM 181602=DAOM 197198]